MSRTHMKKWSLSILICICLTILMWTLVSAHSSSQYCGGFCGFPKKCRTIIFRAEDFSDDVLSYAPRQKKFEIFHRRKTSLGRQRKTPILRRWELISTRLSQQPNTPPTQAAVDRKTYPLVFQVDKQGHYNKCTAPDAKNRRPAVIRKLQ